MPDMTASTHVTAGCNNWQMSPIWNSSRETAHKTSSKKLVSVSVYLFHTKLVFFQFFYHQCYLWCCSNDWCLLTSQLSFQIFGLWKWFLQPLALGLHLWWAARALAVWNLAAGSAKVCWTQITRSNDILKMFKVYQVANIQKASGVIHVWFWEFGLMIPLGAALVS